MTNSRRKSRIPAFAGAISALMFLGTAQAVAPADAPAPGMRVEAVWKAQQLSFVYHADSTRYSCRSLQDKLEAILLSVGAHTGIRLRAHGCEDLSHSARFQVALMSAVEATDENVRAIASHDSKDVLIARLNGERLATAEDVQRFPAVWKTVSLARERTLRLDRGDCELVQQLRRQILSKMSIRIVRDHVRCSSAFGSIGRPGLTVSALVPAP